MGGGEDGTGVEERRVAGVCCEAGGGRFCFVAFVAGDGANFGVGEEYLFLSNESGKSIKEQLASAQRYMCCMQLQGVKPFLTLR